MTDRTAPGPERPGQATVVRWKRLRVSRLSLQLQNPHEPRQSCLSHVDGQVRSRAESDLALWQWRYSSRNFGANPTVSAGNVTSADDYWMQVDPLKRGKANGEGKHHNQKGHLTKSTTNTSQQV